MLELQCNPKIGAGNWAVTGTGNRMKIVTPVAGTGNLSVAGTLDVERHFWLHGTFFMGSGATINVSKDVVLDVGQFQPMECPE